MVIIWYLCDFMEYFVILRNNKWVCKLLVFWNDVFGILIYIFFYRKIIGNLLYVVFWNDFDLEKSFVLLRCFFKVLYFYVFVLIKVLIFGGFLIKKKCVCNIKVLL